MSAEAKKQTEAEANQSKIPRVDKDPAKGWTPANAAMSRVKK